MISENHKRSVLTLVIGAFATILLSGALYFIIKDRMPTKPAGDLMSIVFLDRKGMPHTLAEFKGKSIMVNLWATWCPPCAHEMPALDKLAGKLKEKGAVVIAISADEHPGQVVAFNHRENIQNLPIYTNSAGDFSQAIQSGTIPAFLFFDKDGTLVYKMEGEFPFDTDKGDALLKDKLGISLN